MTGIVQRAFHGGYYSSPRAELRGLPSRSGQVPLQVPKPVPQEVLEQVPEQLTERKVPEQVAEEGGRRQMSCHAETAT